LISFTILILFVLLRILLVIIYIVVTCFAVRYSSSIIYTFTFYINCLNKTNDLKFREKILKTGMVQCGPAVR